MPDYLACMPKADKKAVSVLSRQYQDRFSQNKKGFLRFREPYEALCGLTAQNLDFNKDQVTIGSRDEISDQQHLKVLKVLKEFMPWRKGPFNVFGIEVDTEWQSQRKWNRVIPFLPELKNKVVADIGCSNGYYMFRMAAHQPKCVLGFEPYVQHYFAFKALNQLAGQKNLHIEPFGVEDIRLFPETFDVIFLMGIIYHRISPVEMLRDIKNSLKPGATLILESQAIPGDASVALFPEKTYAKVPGTYFVPTANCLANWLKRVGFENIEFFDSHPMSNDEQRKTDWMTFESYSDFLDPSDTSLTIEGYPAPLRIFFRATAP
nr:tRNA 5-methoxyuridine(34)/uridine 5-oxyacetic acid(34) synthase CmoB [Desulfobulbaceae bacterium]